MKIQDTWPITIIALTALVGSFVLLYFNRDVNVASAIAVSIVTGFLLHSNSRMLTSNLSNLMTTNGESVLTHIETLLGLTSAKSHTPAETTTTTSTTTTKAADHPATTTTTGGSAA